MPKIFPSFNEPNMWAFPSWADTSRPHHYSSARERNSIQSRASLCSEQNQPRRREENRDTRDIDQRCDERSGCNGGVTANLADNERNDASNECPPQTDPQHGDGNCQTQLPAANGLRSEFAFRRELVNPSVGLHIRRR